MKTFTDHKLSKIAENWTKEKPDNIGIKTAFAAGFRLAEQMTIDSLPDEKEIDKKIKELSKNCNIYYRKYTDKEIEQGEQAFRNGCLFVINRFLNRI